MWVFNHRLNKSLILQVIVPNIFMSSSQNLPWVIQYPKPLTQPSGSCCCRTFISLMVFATAQTVCMAVGVVRGVLRGHSSRMCHPAPGGTTLLSVVGENHSNISRAQVTALETGRAMSWSDCPWGLIPTPRGILETFRSLLAAHVKKRFSSSAVCWEQRGENVSCLQLLPSML